MFDVDRRDLMRAIGLTPIALLAARAEGATADLALGPAKGFSWEALKAQGDALAARPFVPRPRSAAADAIGFDAVNAIRYRADRSLWGERDDGRGVRFFPMSSVARSAVAMHVVENGRARAISYSADLFEMPADSPARKLEPGAGFAGFRVMNKGNVGDWLAYQGASYFRSAGPLSQYGLSARGIAIDTAVAGPEEFPDFTAFWLEAGPGDALIVYALLDGPSVAGAYRFVVRREAGEIVQDVTLAVRLRRPVARLGFAAMTSMFWYGEGGRVAAPDWRPEIHDSDGLALQTGTGERIWRPLANPKAVSVNAFADRAPKGFGLMQRDREFAHYQDDGVFYHKRASLWAEPVGDWGAGAVELIELPTVRETEDNIVAFWRPAVPAVAGQRHALSYRLRWLGGEPAATPLGRVVATRIGAAGRPADAPVEGALKIVVDFEGAALKGLDRGSGVTLEVLASGGGRVLSHDAYPIAELPGQWRAVIDVALGTPGPTDLRAYLRRGGGAVSETWLYQLR